MTAEAIEDASPWVMAEVLRRAVGLTQIELAELSGVSRQGISDGERLGGPMKRETAEKLAPVLHVAVPRLLSGRWPEPWFNPRVHARLRASLMDVLDIEPPVTADSAAVREVSQQVRQCWRLYITGENVAVLTSLPAVLARARSIAQSGARDPAATAELHRVLSHAYNIGAGLAGRYGLHDLAFSALQRSRSAAELGTDPELSLAVVQRYMSWTLIRQGRYQEAAVLALRAASGLEPAVSRRAGPQMSVWGNLAFGAAHAYARLGNTDRALEWIAAARRVCRGLEFETVSETGIFGPRAVLCQSVEIHRLCGDPEEALRQGSQTPAGPGSAPAFFEAGHRLHLAAAALDLGRKNTACQQLHLAHDTAPEWVRGQPLGPELVQRLLLMRRGQSRHDTRFTTLARGYGLIGGAE